MNRGLSNALSGFGLLSIILLAACGGAKEQEATKFPGVEMPVALVAVNHPELTGLEPMAAKSIGEQQTALEPLVATGQKTPAAADIYGRLGMSYFSFRYKDAAEASLRNALVADPENARWNFYLGKLYEDRSEPMKAAYFLDRAYNADPARISIQAAYAESLRVLDRSEEAEQLFRAVVEKEPEHAVALFGLGRVAAAAGRHDEAVEHFKSVLQIQPRATAVHYPFGLSLRAVGQADMAEQFLAARGDLEPYVNDPLMAKINGPRAEAHYRMAETLRLAQKLEESLPHYELVIELLPEDPNPRLGRVIALIQLERFLGAAIALQDDLMDFPRKAVFHHMMARILASSPDERARNGQQALKLLRPLTEGQVTPELTETLAMAFAEVGLFEDAVKAQEKALSLAQKVEDQALADRLKVNLSLFRKQEPSRNPWRADDPIFKKVTYPANPKG